MAELSPAMAANNHGEMLGAHGGSCGVYITSTSSRITATFDGLQPQPVTLPCVCGGEDVERRQPKRARGDTVPRTGERAGEGEGPQLIGSAAAQGYRNHFDRERTLHDAHYTSGHSRSKHPSQRWSVLPHVIAKQRSSPRTNEGAHVCVCVCRAAPTAPSGSARMLATGGWEVGSLFS